MALTETAVRNAKPGKRPRKISDGGGLFLLVQPTGGKLWRLAYRFAGKQKLLAIGIYPEISLAIARDGRSDAKRLLQQGTDPSVQRRIERQRAESAATNTFRIIAEELLAKYEREGRAEITLAKHRWLYSFAYPSLGDRPISDITASDLLRVLRVLGRKGCTRAPVACAAPVAGSSDLPLLPVGRTGIPLPICEEPSPSPR